MKKVIALFVCIIAFVVMPNSSQASAFNDVSYTHAQYPENYVFV
ncbi:hypothetical protein [Caryophanon latum]|nr:hypothetical protein [Caryophanon latum]